MTSSAGKAFPIAKPALRSVSDVALRVTVLMLLASIAGAQDLSPLTTPAERVLRLRAELQLDSAQVARLRDLSRTQATSLGRATAAFLRAEADVVDAARSEDLVVRRGALERRSKAAIDGEMLRLRSEKETVAILTAKQNDLLGILQATSANDSGRLHAIWESQVTPLPLNAAAFVVPDSGTVRVTIDPLSTEIYIADRLVAYGRLATRLPLGQHTLKFRAPGGCLEMLAIVVERGPPTILTHKMSCQQ